VEFAAVDSNSSAAKVWISAKLPQDYLSNTPKKNKILAIFSSSIYIPAPLLFW
jgi:hypothetical protein